nr:ABC-type transport auxiliary lipoprotein family protein [Desulfobaculum xiamenense]
MLLTLFLAGCSTGLSKPAPEIRHYVLRPELPQPAATARPGVLKVRRAVVSPGFAGRELIFRTGETTYSIDYYDQFLVAPADMLTQALRDAMGAAALFASVSPEASVLRPDYVLETTAVTMHGDFREGRDPAAVLEMQFFLLKDSDTDYDIVLTRTYAERMPFGARTAQAYAKAMERAVSSILARLAADIATLPQP